MGEVEASVSEPELTLTERKVINQLEYYFGDINLPKDKFLLEEIKKDDGWIPIETMLKFNRLKRVTEDKEIIAAAVSKSAAGGLLELSEDKEKIRRSPSKTLPNSTLEYWRELKSRTAYVKGFPQDSGLDDIQEFLEKYGKTAQITMRRMRDEKRTFKGSIFVAFISKEEMDKFLSAESLKFKDSEEELIRMRQDQYYKKKTDEKKKNRQAGGDHDDKKKEKTEFTKNVVVKVGNIPDDLDRDALKEIFGEHEKVAFVDYQKGAKEGYIRFVSDAEVPLSKMKNDDGKILLKDTEITADILTGDDEVAYQKRITEFAGSRNNRGGGQNRGGGGRGGRGGRGRGRGRGGGRGGRGGRHQHDNTEAPQDGSGEGEDKGTKVKFDADGPAADSGEPPAKKVKDEAAVKAENGAAAE